MAATQATDGQNADQGGLKFKQGAYLTPKVERIMMHLARKRSIKWIAELHRVRESIVVYVARKTGFPPSTLVGYDPKAAEAHAHDARDEPDAQAVRDAREELQNAS